jgi:hypothetical protein
MQQETLVVVACKPMWQNMQAYQTIANNPCTHINAEMLLEFKMDYTMTILLCPLMKLSLPKRISSGKSTVETKKCSEFRAINLMEDILITSYKCILSVITLKLNISGHLLIRIFVLVLARGTRAQSVSVPLSHTLYKIQGWNFKEDARKTSRLLDVSHSCERMFQNSVVRQSRDVSDNNWQTCVDIAVLLQVRELQVNQSPQTDFTKIDRVLKYDIWNKQKLN